VVAEEELSTQVVVELVDIDVQCQENFLEDLQQQKLH
jgi:hypothetical protein